MAPVPTSSESRPQLLKRIIYYYGNNSSRPWWIVFIVVIPIIAFLLIYCALARRRNIKRKQQGQPILPYSGWTMYGQNNINNGQQAPPFNPNYHYKPENQQYGQNSNLPTYNQATYSAPEGPPPNNAYYAANNTEFQRPEAPPPNSATSDYPSYPNQTYTKN